MENHGATAIVPPGPSRWARTRDRAGLVVAWAVWFAMTIYAILYIRQYSRNLPFLDDFQMLPALTGSVRVSLEWAWSQHIEHRPFISRLVLVGLWRHIADDFRVARYANLALLSMMAAAMLLLARRLRGSARVTDAVLPLAILNIAQTETLMIGFAMNLVSSSFIAVALIVGVGICRGRDGGALVLIFGPSVALLPLTGGSGLAILPPLALWLAGDIVWGWWSGRRPGTRDRAIGLGMLLAGSFIVALYFHGYQRPAHHPLARSPWAAAVGALKFLSLSLHPRVHEFWWPTGLLVLGVVTATVLLLAVAAYRTPRERPRALGLMAIVLSMLNLAVVIGFSRGGLGPIVPLMGRYVTLAFPLLAAIYIAWVEYGPPRVRVAIHTVLLALLVLTLPHNYRYATEYGRRVLIAEKRVERALKEHKPTAVLLKHAFPTLFPDRQYLHDSFRIMRAARMGLFADLEDDRVTTAADPGGAVRR
jgi:hypothetical protein